MEINIKGNPGTGNSFTEIKIEHADSVNPNATTVSVIHNHYGSEKMTTSRQQPKDVDNIDTTPIRTEILNYVSCLRPLLKEEWKSCYMKLWEGILDLDIIEEQIYHPGKQQGTNFNRSLVANIIHYLGSKGINKDDYNATTVTVALEGDKDHTVRNSLGKDPAPDIISRLNRFFETFEV